MSKLSVFHFDCGNADKQYVEAIVLTYLKSRHFFYDSEQHCYRTGKPSKTEQVTNIVVSAAATLAATIFSGAGEVFINHSVIYAMEYEFIGNELTIKAYILGKKGKSYIHSTLNQSKAAAYFYNDLKRELFPVLKQHNTPLTNKEIEKLKDGFEFRIAMMIVLPFAGTALALILGLFIYAAATGQPLQSDKNTSQNEISQSNLWGQVSIDVSLPDEPIIFDADIFINPDDENDKYISVEYNGRTYIKFGSLNGTIDGDDVGNCLGYYVESGKELKNVRFFLLNDVPDQDILVRFEVAATASMPVFFRAIDTRGQTIHIPNYIAYPDDDLFWN